MAAIRTATRCQTNFLRSYSATKGGRAIDPGCALPRLSISSMRPISRSFFPVVARPCFPIRLRPELCTENGQTQYIIFISIAYGGGGGIRTHVTVSRKHAFQACAFSHSATPPYHLALMARTAPGHDT